MLLPIYLRSGFLLGVNLNRDIESTQRMVKYSLTFNYIWMTLVLSNAWIIHISVTRIYKTLIFSCISVSSLFARLHFEVLWSVTASNETVEAEIFVFFIYFLIGSANIGEATS